MEARLARLRAAAAVEPEERRLAGVVAGGLYGIGGITLASFVVLPGVTHAHRVALLAIGASSLAWGLCSSRLVDWLRAPWWAIQVSPLAGFAVIALAIASSGGAVSPAWIYLFFVAVFAAYFFRRAVAIAYLAGCVAIHALSLLYDPRALHDAFVAQIAVAAPAYLAFGAAIIAGKRLMWTHRLRAEELAAEQGALRRVATAVVGGATAERFYELVAREAAWLLGAGAAGILRLENPSEALVMGSWADQLGGFDEPGTIVEVSHASHLGQAVETGRPVRIDAHGPETRVGRLGYSCSIVSPVQVAGATWGVLAVTALFPVRLTVDDERRLTDFGELLATAITSIEDRAKLAAQASTDPLTGLANHRTLRQRLSVEVARATRHGGVLSVAVIDVDHFKQINDTGGHEMGDETLLRVADCLSSLVRTEDVLARAGGDEFAWVLPQTNSEQALLSVERARETIARDFQPPYNITVSAGICDTTVTEDPTQLINFADGALYWSKAHGRNQVSVYDPAIVNELSAKDRAERLERSRALVGLRALARAIDAKDPATRAHSERVSVLAGKLARAARWSPERAQLLSEAALVHDVGKIGIPDAVLRKAEPLTGVDRAQMAVHTDLSARIVEGVLAPEQVEWIRNHHERPDGEGYPDGLRDEEISDGAALLAVADTWDVMTVSRPYSVPKTPREALEECLSLIGTQFMPAAVAALEQLGAAGELTDEQIALPLRTVVVTGDEALARD